MTRVRTRPSCEPFPVLSVARTSCRSSYSRPRLQLRRARCRTVPHSHSDLRTSCHVKRQAASNHLLTFNCVPLNLGLKTAVLGWPISTLYTPRFLKKSANKIKPWCTVQVLALSFVSNVSAVAYGANGATAPPGAPLRTTRVIRANPIRYSGGGEGGGK